MPTPGVREHLRGGAVRLRAASLEDVAYLVALGQRSEIADFLAAVTPWAEADVRAAIAAAADDRAAQGRFVLEVEHEGAWQRAGGLAFSMQNERSRIAHLFGVMVDPAFRSRGLGERAVRLLTTHLVRDLGYHRVQLEAYGFNEAALRLFERAGFVREGVKRRAYWRHGAWQDGVVFGLVEEDLRA